MQNELKSTIRFNDFVAYFGARGVVALAWWMGAAHAARIRQDQNSFPFLQIIGAAGSGKSLLLDYLQKLNGQTPYGHSLAHATPAGRAHTFALAGQRVVICEDNDESGRSVDWDELKPLYNSGSIFLRSAARDKEKGTFRGALVITANQPLKCSEAVSSRMILVDLSATDAPTPRVRPEAIGDLDACEASAFGIKVDQSEDWICNNLQAFLPAYQGQLARQYGASLNARTALNCAQMICLIDLLCKLLSISQELQLEARKLIRDIAFLDTIPY
ncbi:hypothetical protein A9978_17280 [Pseudomonas sp. UMC65]|uniref:DUF5906 domain-containing protein n=1 Tax=unclassified Pseudomonas TaxID=196821 RepID=UPI00160439C6|nr:MULTISPECIES: DUF5906 domain-containing protein [unclassified Pseudomonas]MBB1614203.1 hypothetical protein [Pseudomonas sp. UMC65]MBB1617579.1 hypothetical protein [Pseudomonas sp. UME65]